MDARRNQVYTGLYEFNKEEFQIVKQQNVVTVEEIIDTINQRGKEVIFLGDGTAVYKDIIQEKIKVDYQFAPVHLNRQRAGAVGALAIQLYQKKQIETAEQHEPVYLRLSQAERERAERMK
jgi:tRNA threonylcarbamoyladenosine biosynthesis protein TsaB